MDNKELTVRLDEILEKIHEEDYDDAIFKIENIKYKLKGAEDNFFEIRDFLDARDFGSWDINYSNDKYQITGRFVAYMSDKWNYLRYYINVPLDNCDYQETLKAFKRALENFDSKKEAEKLFEKYKDEIEEDKKQFMQILQEGATYVKFRFTNVVNEFEREFCKKRD